MIAIDQFLIAQYERLGHWVQRWTGVNCLRLAWLCLAGYVAVSLLQIGFAGKASAWDWFFTAVMLLILLREYFREHRFYEDRNDGLRNLKEADPILRAIRVTYAISVLLLQVTVVLLIVLKGTSAGTFLAEMRGLMFLSWLYLEACTPLPPSEDRIKWKVARQVPMETTG